jgi:hypothetical protein
MGDKVMLKILLALAVLAFASSAEIVELSAKNNGTLTMPLIWQGQVSGSDTLAIPPLVTRIEVIGSGVSVTALDSTIVIDGTGMVKVGGL